MAVAGFRGQQLHVSELKRHIGGFPVGTTMMAFLALSIACLACCVGILVIAKPTIVA